MVLALAKCSARIMDARTRKEKPFFPAPCGVYILPPRKYYSASTYDFEQRSVL